MYDRVLVTLDGSPLAECALDPAAWAACALGADELTLVRVSESGGVRETQRAESYLTVRAVSAMKSAIEAFREAGLSVPKIRWRAVRSTMGSAAPAIIRFSESNGADLVVMSTHGRTGIYRWLMGSVAEKVLRGAGAPVLMVPATKSVVIPGRMLQRILVPLDGSELAERCLSTVEQLAKIPGSDITLLHVEPHRETGLFSGGRGPAHLNGHHREEVDSYLGSIADQLAAEGARVASEIRKGTPSLEIVDAVRDGNVDMVVMSTHGHSGHVDWAFGSTADQVLRTSPVPVLLVRSQVTAETPDRLRSLSFHRCHHCGLRTGPEEFSDDKRCLRCAHLLKACGNCVHSDGLFCLIQRPEAAEAYAGNSCEEFEFRETPVLSR